MNRYLICTRANPTPVFDVAPDRPMPAAEAAYLRRQVVARIEPTARAGCRRYDVITGQCSAPRAAMVAAATDARAAHRAGLGRMAGT